MKGTQKLEVNPIRQYDDFDLMDYLLPLAARWKLLLVVTLLGSIIGFTFSHFLPKIYESSATIYVQSSSTLSSQLSDLPIALGPSSSDSTNYLLVLLQSDTFAQSIINKLDLTHNPDFTHRGPSNPEDLLREFEKGVSVQQGKNGNITISVKSNKPELAADIANEMLNHLGKVALTRSDRKKEYTAQKLKETSRNLDKAQRELQKFLEDNSISSVDDEAKLIVAQLTELESKSMSVDADIASLRSQLANAGNLDNLVDYEVQLKTLESGRSYISSKIEEAQKKIAQLPAVAARYARIQRNIASLSKTYEILTEQYQMASITRQGEDGDYQIIDRARPNPKNVAPRKMLNTVLCGFIGFLVTVVIIHFRIAADYRRHKYSKKFVPLDPDVDASKV